MPSRNVVILLVACKTVFLWFISWVDLSHGCSHSSFVSDRKVCFVVASSASHPVACMSVSLGSAISFMFCRHLGEFVCNSVAWDSCMGRGPLYVYPCTFESDVVHRLDHSPDNGVPYLVCRLCHRVDRRLVVYEDV